MQQTETSHQQFLIAIRGLPGSGKSHLANALQQAYGSGQVIVLDPDKLDTASQAYKDLCAQLTAKGVDAKFFPNRFLKEQGYQAIREGKSIIWTQAFTDLGGFVRSTGALQEFAAAQGTQLPLLVVEIAIDPAIARARTSQREQSGEHGVSDEAWARFIASYESFAGKGHTPTIVAGQQDIAVSVAAVQQALRHLLG